jgi:glucuronosyltransferase
VAGPTHVRAFISHCGLNSVMEAVKAGIPLICIPFFGDQLNNSEGIASRDVAIVIGKISTSFFNIDNMSAAFLNVLQF